MPQSLYEELLKRNNLLSSTDEEEEDSLYKRLLERNKLSSQEPEWLTDEIKATQPVIEDKSIAEESFRIPAIPFLPPQISPSVQEVADISPFTKTFWDVVKGNTAEFASLANKVVKLTPHYQIHKKLHPEYVERVDQVVSDITEPFIEQKEEARSEYFSEHAGPYSTGPALAMSAAEFVDIWDLFPTGLLVKYGSKLPTILRSLGKFGGKVADFAEIPVPELAKLAATKMGTPGEKLADLLEWSLVKKASQKGVTPEEALAEVVSSKIYKEELPRAAITEDVAKTELSSYKLKEEISGIEDRLASLQKLRGSSSDEWIGTAKKDPQTGKFEKGIPPAEEFKQSVENEMEDLIVQLVQKQKQLDEIETKYPDEAFKAVDEEPKGSTVRSSTEQYGEDYVDTVLEVAGKGPPGLEASAKGVIYRDSEGKPIIAALTYGTDEVKDMAKLNVGGLGQAKAFKAVMEKIRELGLKAPDESKMSAEGKNLYDKLATKVAREVRVKETRKFADLASKLSTKVDNVTGIPTNQINSKLKSIDQITDQLLPAASRAVRGSAEAKTKVQNLADELIQLKHDVISPGSDRVVKAKKLSDEEIYYISQLAEENSDVPLLKFIQVQNNPKLSDYALDAFVHSILSSLGTPIRNLLGGGTHLTTMAYSTMVRPALAKLIKVGGPYNAENAKAAMYGASIGWQRGLEEFMTIWRKGIDLDDVNIKYGTRHAFLNSPNKFLRGFGRMIEPVSKALHSVDAVVYSMGKNLSLYEQASKLAQKSGKDYLTELERLANNPTDEMIREAVKHANFARFTDETSKVSDVFSHFKEVPVIGLPMKFLTPFVKVSDRLTVRGLEMTPYGMWAAYRANRAAKLGGKAATKNKNIGRELDLIARSIAGTTIAGALAGYMRYDPHSDNLPFIMGKMPSNRVEKDMLYAQGVRPHSARFGDTYVPFSQIEPFGSVFSMVAAIHQAITDNEEDNLTENMIQSVGNFLGAVLDRTTLQNLQDIFDLSRRPESSKDVTTKLVSRIMSGTAIPYSGLLRQAGRIIDPYLRQQQDAKTTLSSFTDFANNVIAQVIPQVGIGGGQPMQYDVRGRPVDLYKTRPAGFLTATGTPLDFSEIQLDPTYQALTELKNQLPENKQSDVLPNWVDSRLTPLPGGPSVRLTPEEQNIYLQLSNIPFFERIDKVIQSPSWQTMTPDQKRRRVKAYKTAYRQRAQTMMKNYLRIVTSDRLTNDQKEKRLHNFNKQLAKILKIDTIADLPSLDKATTFKR